MSLEIMFLWMLYYIIKVCTFLIIFIMLQIFGNYSLKYILIGSIGTEIKFSLYVSRTCIYINMTLF